MTRIICIGSSLVAEDAVGPRVYARLAGSELPAEVELLDGGLRGLDLLPLVEGAERVVFVDRVVGLGALGDVVVLDREEAAALAPGRCDHAGGLAYLLRCLPAVLEGAMPEVRVVGVEASSADDRAIGEAAARALALAATPVGRGPLARCP